jgi:hypothetical protein
MQVPTSWWYGQRLSVCLHAVVFLCRNALENKIIFSQPSLSNWLVFVTCVCMYARMCVPLFKFFSVQTGEWTVLFKVWQWIFQFPPTSVFLTVWIFHSSCGHCPKLWVTAWCWPRENLMLPLHRGCTLLAWVSRMSSVLELLQEVPLKILQNVPFKR